MVHRREFLWLGIACIFGCARKESTSGPRPSNGVSIEGWTSPYLNHSSFAVCLERRTASGKAQVEELDGLVDQLSEAIDFEGSFATCNRIVDRRSPPPSEEDFESVELFSAVVESFYPGQFDPKPWLRQPEMDREELRAFLRKKLQWSINNKQYFLPSRDQPNRVVAFSHKTKENKVIAQQEADHQNRVDDLIDSITRHMAPSQNEVFESNHLLRPYAKLPPGSFAQAVCDFDEAIVIVSRTHIVLIWIGHIRSYG